MADTKVSHKKAKIDSGESKSTLSNRMPVVDLRDDEASIVAKMKSAARDLGFFQVINHNIKSAPSALEAAKEFYSFPTAKKNEHKLVYAAGEMLRGYASLGAEAADVANLSLTGQEAIPDLMESFQLADPSYVDDQYPTEKMREHMIPLYNEMALEGKKLLNYLAQALPSREEENQLSNNSRKSGREKKKEFDDEEESDVDLFSKRHGGMSRTVLRVTRYPALNECGIAAVDDDDDDDNSKNKATTSKTGGDDNNKVSRISPHRDLGTLTLLMQDSQGGLEVQDPDTEEWVPVPPVEGAMVVNIGNLMTRWTAGYFRSSIHRVMATKGTSHSKEDRYSVIFFMNPNDDFDLEPLKRCKRITLSRAGGGKKKKKNQNIKCGVNVGEYMACKLTQLFDPEARADKGACCYDD
jgi:isopenicillin N synthase-like dioxygenase